MQIDENQIPSKAIWTPLDDALHGPTDLFQVEPKEAEKLNWRAIKFILNYHYDRNRFYHTVCEQRGFTPNNVRMSNEIEKVSLISGVVFKQYPEPGLADTLAMRD